MQCEPNRPRLYCMMPAEWLGKAAANITPKTYERSVHALMNCTDLRQASINVSEGLGSISIGL